MKRVYRAQETLNCGKSITDTLDYCLMCHFFLLPYFNIICDLLLNEHTATWNLFVNHTQKAGVNILNENKN